MRRVYDKTPSIQVPIGDGCAVAGWDAVASRLQLAIQERAAPKTVIIIECYPGVDETEIARELGMRFADALLLRTGSAFLPEAQVNALVEPFLGGNDPVFGFLCGLTLPQFFEPQIIHGLKSRTEMASQSVVLIVGCGARLIHRGDILVYADLARREGQLRFRRNEANNLGVQNQTAPASLQYKRAFFVDWRVCDRWKRRLLPEMDFLLDTNDAREPKLAEGNALRRALHHATTRPFRVVPFFDPAPWGGQWMKEVCDLNRSVSNYGWCFDCVPEENSLLLDFGKVRIEIPSLDVVFHQPERLLGEAVHARFGDEFPIRFDFLDTMGGGNLSFQVHPLTEYIQHHFGMHYTQDESYYILDAAPGATVYLGLRDVVDSAEMARQLASAQRGETLFDAERFANRWPAKRHDHFLIPAGTVHCSGADCMVLEISATPYIFTFKMWDWGRLGLDGKPRPIHLEHGLANVHWNRTTAWVQRELINRVEPLAQGDGWREERTGLHEREFIETRRHWFTRSVAHHTRGGVNVLNLIQGEAAVVESPAGAFEPFMVSFAETFIVPAAVGDYTIRPLSGSTTEHATIKASVRT